MLDVVEYLVGGSLVAAGYLAGSWAARKTAAKAKAASPQPICPCTHSIGHHKDQKGACTSQVKRREFRNGPGYIEVWVPCGCLHYSGPELLSTFMVRELKDG